MMKVWMGIGVLIAAVVVGCAPVPVYEIPPDPGVSPADQEVEAQSLEVEARRRRCKSGEQECSGRCVDVRSDAFHCGGCGQVCGPRGFCSDGVCQHFVED
ncbi:hypothetical protein DL240_10875 [Lujinxingia litoralis]|uniref:Uncharacterized protein n=1 Tax=Lujinxingia litoralis TaxID=2211119 RepID=A0A328C7F0_9DELT|nr:hypothetical protein [Lujinxingia litoralis]RAL22344.1 hypothetical protein DL240_10875 [Lujinxingia litoralis]